MKTAAPVRNDARRAACLESLEQFCKVYFPRIFSRPFASDQLGMIAGLENVIRGRERIQRQRLDRGRGTTSLLIAGAQWAMLGRRRRNVWLVENTMELSLCVLEAFFIELEDAELLLADFPEAAASRWRRTRDSGRMGRGPWIEAKWLGRWIRGARGPAGADLALIDSPRPDLATLKVLAEFPENIPAVFIADPTADAW